ncbi:MAG: hypothetical protein ACJ77A_05530 [Actinomycetota bacterium]
MKPKPGPSVLEGRAELLRFLAEIGQAARDELLLGLQAPSHVRAAIIAQCYRTEGARHLGELLEKLERDEPARAEVVQALREFTERPFPRM